MYAVIWHNPFCITLLSSLYGDRQQRVRRPPHALLAAAVQQRDLHNVSGFA